MPALKEGRGRMLVATGIFLATWLLIVPACLWAESGAVLEVGKFSASQVGQVMPDGWKPLTFKKIPKHTSYEVVKDGEHVVVKATSDASASGLTKEVRIDPKEFPIVRWQWKIDNLLQKRDATRKDGDDYPARLYITFEYDPDKVNFSKKLKFKAGQVVFGDIPIGAISYVRKGSRVKSCNITSWPNIPLERAGARDIFTAWKPSTLVPAADSRSR